MAQKRLLSGMQPTGILHLGNYEVLKNWVQLQNDYESFFFIANWHCLTTMQDRTDQIIPNTRQVAADFIAAGLDPVRSTIFVQSDVPEHAELHLMLSMITSLGWLERVPSFKEKRENLALEDSVSYGLLGYPVLMASDILMYLADAVPVGEDQLPHLELTRELGRRWNHIYGELFPEPAAIVQRIKKLPGLDGRKMSKSYDNAIYLSDDADTVWSKIRNAYTDPLKIRKDDPGHPEGCTVFALHQAYSPDVDTIESECREGTRGCVACKKQLCERINNQLDPLRSRRNELMTNPGELDAILKDGAARARVVASDTMQSVRKMMKIG
ncbi:MAG: tryptophan--tRNA ligase [Armatimonadota bacterium]